MKSFFCKLAVVFGLALFAIPGASWGQASNAANAAAGVGQLAELGRLAGKLGIEDDLPVKLRGLLWPDAGSGQKKCAVKKVLMPGKNETEGRIFFVRLDNHDLVLMRHTEAKPDGDSKLRQEFYYRTTAQGDLTLALTASFQFAKDDADNDVLKKATWQTYGEAAGDGAKPQPITPDLKAKFETEKKFWLGVEKTLKKMERNLKK